MGIPLYFGYASGADVNVFPLAQMMYPAAASCWGTWSPAVPTRTYPAVSLCFTC